MTVEDGRLTSVTGNPEHPFTRGVICGKVHDYAERVYSPLRVLHPMRRVGVTYVCGGPPWRNILR